MPKQKCCGGKDYECNLSAQDCEVMFAAKKPQRDDQPSSVPSYAIVLSSCLVALDYFLSPLISSCLSSFISSSCSLYLFCYRFLCCHSPFPSSSPSSFLLSPLSFSLSTSSFILCLLLPLLSSVLIFLHASSLIVNLILFICFPFLDIFLFFFLHLLSCFYNNNHMISASIL